MSTYNSPFVSVEELLALKNGSGSGRGTAISIGVLLDFS